MHDLLDMGARGARGTRDQLIQSICNAVQSAQSMLPTIMVTVHNYNSVLSSNPLPLPPQYSSIPDDICREMRTLRHETVITIQFSKQHQQQATFFFYSHSPLSKPKLAKTIWACSTWIYIARTMATDCECGHPLTTYVYLTSHEKRFPIREPTREPSNRTDILGPVHVNTAFTYACTKSKSSKSKSSKSKSSKSKSSKSDKPNATITIYRREEWFKVFIHETFHCFGLDYSGDDQATHTLDGLVRVRFPKECAGIAHIRSYEGFTECWARIWNAAICAVIQPSHPTKSLASNFNDNLAREVTNTNIMRDRIGEYQRAHSNKEDSSVFSYFILCAFLMNQLLQTPPQTPQTLKQNDNLFKSGKSGSTTIRMSVCECSLV